MSMIRHNEGRLVVGVDLGGTQIRVLALTDGRPCGRYQGATTDEDGLGNLLRKLWKRQQWSARTVAALVVAAKGDRKSTRLNSSHLGISYAVFCLKKKKQHAK